jgi:uncharacterized membrane protein
VSWIPDPLHPAVVHFPIALSLVALLLAVLARNRRLRGLEPGALALVVLAALAAVVAVLTGHAAHDEAIVPAGARGLIASHEEVGELAMWWLLGVAAVRVLLAWRGWYSSWRSWAYVLLLAVAAGMVSYNGYLGGKMVYDHGVGTAPVQRQGARSVAPSPDRPT